MRASATSGHEPDLTESDAVPVARTGLVGTVRRLYALEPVRFVLVGGINSAFSFLLFAGLQTALQDHVHYLWVLSVTTAIGILEAYLLQRWITFRASGHWWADLARFSSVYLVAFVANLGLLPLLVEVVGVPVLPAQAIIMVANAVCTYLAHRLFSFRRA
jgi:putative flippase GtrA